MVKRKQAREDFVVGHLPGTPVVVPSICIGHCGIERRVRVGEPLRASVVEVGERALFQLFRGLLVPWEEAVGVARDNLGLAYQEVGRIEPILAKLVQAGCGSRNRLRARVVAVYGRRDVGGQASGEGKGRENRSVRIARSILEVRPFSQRL